MIACGWCRRPFEPTRSDAIFCGRRCRQSAFRMRLRHGDLREGLAASSERPLRFAYADPPYPGLAARYYGNEPDFGGEVDHGELIAGLERRRREDAIAGWALSTSGRLSTLRGLMPHLPSNAELYPWVKPIGVSSLTYGAHNAWEALIVVPGRRMRPGFRDWLSAQPARGGGELIGRKPIAFCAFLFRCLGMLPGDSIDDIFPGTGIIGRAWAEIGRSAPAADDASATPSATGPRGVDDGSSMRIRIAELATGLIHDDEQTPVFEANPFRGPHFETRDSFLTESVE